MTKAYKVAEFDNVSRERDNYMLALHDELCGSVVWSKWHREDGGTGKYRVGMTRLDSASGGLVLVTYRHDGQSDTTNVLSVDSFYGGYLNQALSDAMYEARNAWHATVTEVA